MGTLWLDCIQESHPHQQWCWRLAQWPQPPSLWTGTASNVFVDKVPTQRSYTYRPPDPSCFREEIEENTATQVPRAAGEAACSNFGTSMKRKNDQPKVCWKHTPTSTDQGKVKVDKFNSRFRRGVNRGMQIRRSLVFLGPIRRSDLIFVQIRIRVTLKIFRGI